MNFIQPLFHQAIDNQQRRNRVRLADGRYHHTERRFTEALWRWR